MAADIPTSEPAVFNAGSTVKFTRELSDYLPADGWTLSYALVKAGALITWTGTNNGDGTHLVNITAAITAGYTAGTYSWQSYVTKGSGASASREDISRGVIEIKPNFATQTGGYDGRSDTKIILDAIIATIKGTATKEEQEMTVAGQTLKLRSVDDLIALHKRYLGLYLAEQGKLVRKVLTQF